MRYNNQTFTGVSVELDGNTFVRCNFSDCEAIYRGGTLPVLDACSAHNVRFTFQDAAGNTLLLLAHLYQLGFDAAVEAVLNNIKTKTSNDALTVDSDTPS